MSPAFSPADIRSVLVVKPSSLGDIVHTLPSIHLLKRKWPHLEISWVVNTEWAPLLAGNSDLQARFLFPRKSFRSLQDIYRLRDWVWELGRLKPDLALDFQGLMRSAFIAKLSGARRVHCLADAEITPRFLSDRVVPAIRSEEHAVTRYLKLVADLGVDPGSPIEFPLPAGDQPAGVDLPEGYLLIHPFSRGAGKSLPPDCLERIVRQLSPTPVVLVGRADEGFSVPAGCVSLLNRTSLSELIWLIRHARFTMSVDSGPMHIAAGLTPRLLGIHNWTDPMLVGPYNMDAWVWKNGRIARMREFTRPSESNSAAFGIEHADATARFLAEQLAA